MRPGVFLAPDQISQTYEGQGVQALSIKPYCVAIPVGKIHERRPLSASNNEICFPGPFLIPEGSTILTTEDCKESIPGVEVKKVASIPKAVVDLCGAPRLRENIFFPPTKMAMDYFDVGRSRQDLQAILKVECPLGMASTATPLDWAANLFRLLGSTSDKEYMGNMILLLSYDVVELIRQLAAV